MVIKDKDGIPDILGLASETARMALLPREDWLELYNDVFKTYKDMEEVNSWPEKYDWKIVTCPESGILVAINDKLKLTLQGKDRKEIVEDIIGALSIIIDSYKEDLEEFYKKKKSSDFFWSVFVFWTASSVILSIVFEFFVDVNSLIPVAVGFLFSFFLAKKLNKKK